MQRLIHVFSLILSYVNGHKAGYPQEVSLGISDDPYVLDIAVSYILIAIHNGGEILPLQS
jgi:hypothetical protein